jgi:hypothetical protein
MLKGRVGAEDHNFGVFHGTTTIAGLIWFD